MAFGRAAYEDILKNDSKQFTAEQILEAIGFYNQDVTALSRNKNEEAEKLKEFIKTFEEKIGEYQKETFASEFINELKEQLKNIENLAQPQLIPIPASPDITRAKQLIQEQQAALNTAKQALTELANKFQNELRIKANNAIDQIKAIQEEKEKKQAIANLEEKFKAADAARQTINSLTNTAPTLGTPNLQQQATAADAVKAAVKAAQDQLNEVDALKNELLLNSTSAKVLTAKTTDIKNTLSEQVDAAITELNQRVKAAVDTRQAELDRLSTPADLQTEFNRLITEASATRDSIYDILSNALPQNTITDSCKSTLQKTYQNLHDAVVALDPNEGDDFINRWMTRLSTGDNTAHQAISDYKSNTGNQASLIAAKREVTRLHEAAKQALLAAEKEIEAARKNLIKTIDDSTHTQEKAIRDFLNDLDDTDKNKILNDPSFKKAITDYDNTVTVPLYGANTTITDLSSYSSDKSKHPIQNMPLAELTKKSKDVNAAITALSKAFDAAKLTIGGDEEVKRKKILKEIQAEMVICDNLIEDNFGKNNRKDQAIRIQIKNELDLIEPLNGQLKKLKTNYQPTSSLLAIHSLKDLEKGLVGVKKLATDLEKAVDAAAKAYDALAAKPAPQPAAPQPSLDDQKKKFTDEIITFYNKPENANIRNDLDDAAKNDDSLKTLNTDLINAENKIGPAIQDIKNANNQADLDAAKNKLDAVKNAYTNAIRAAQGALEPHRVKHVAAKFKRYVERIDLIEGIVELVAKGDSTDTKYKDTLAEIERLKVDMELYQAWAMGKNNQKAVNDAQKCIDKLDGIINALKGPAPTGMRHFGNYSIKVDDTDAATGNKGGEKTYEDNIAKAKKDILALTNSHISSGTAMHGSLSSGSTLQNIMEQRTTKDFTKLDIYEGRVNSTITGSGKSKTVAIEVQRISKDGARVEEIQFVTDNKTNKPLYDGSTQIYSHPTGIAFGFHTFSSDAVNEMAIRHVLKYLFANQSEDLRNKSTDGALKDLIEGKIDPALRQAAQGQTIYINGNLPDTYARAVRDFCDFIGVKCVDSRNGNDCTIISSNETSKNRTETYRRYIHENAKVLFKDDIKPAVISNTTAADLVKATTPSPKP